MALKRLKVISSVLLYVLLALPVWWQVTSIHRPPIPADRIQQAVDDVTLKSTKLPVEVLVYHVGPGATDRTFTSEAPLLSGATYMVEEATGACSSPPCLNLTQGVLGTAKTNQQLDSLLHGALQQAGLSRPNLYVLFILPPPAALSSDESSPAVVVGQYRHAWVLHSSQPGHDADLVDKIRAGVPALEKMLGYQKGNSAVSELPISAASQTALSFSLCNADPSSGFYTWDFSTLRDTYLQPVVDVLAPVVQLFIHSQVLYHTPSPAAVKWSEQHRAYIVNEKELPFFIDSNWNLESGRSVIGTTGGTTDSSMTAIAAATTPPSVLHWVVFIPPPSQRPLKIRLRGGALSPSNSFWIPSWGGVIIVNPDEAQQKGAPAPSAAAAAAARGLQRELSAADLQAIAGVVVSHLHSLLGVPNANSGTAPSSPGVHIPNLVFLPALQDGFTLWEVEHLVRRTVQQRVVGAAQTLQSLARLVEDLPNLEMPDLIGDQVWQTLEAINNTLQAVHEGSYLEAAANATQARGSAEVAFSHPAVLAQLNFPESHKLGIYMPYFLPVAVPLLQATIVELKRHVLKKKAPRAVN